MYGQIKNNKQSYNKQIAQKEKGTTFTYSVNYVGTITKL
jgi:hypothetical protein